MKAQPRGRRFQDEAFEVSDLRGRRLEHLFGCTSQPELDDRPEMMFLKARGGLWQRFFLDAGIGFWEEWSESDAFRDYAHLRRVDYGARFRVIGDQVLRVSCYCEAPGEPARIVLVLTSGEIRLRRVDSGDPESDSELTFCQLEKVNRDA